MRIHIKILLTIVVLTCSFGAITSWAQSNEFQNFDDWPIDFHNSWETNTIDGWTLNDGLIKVAFGGFGEPISVACAWLPDDDVSTNASLLSPYLPYGAAEVSFWVRRNTGTSNENFFALQHSNDGTNWVTDQTYDRMQDDWQEMSVALDILTPLYIRIIKTGDAGDNQYLGIDDVFIELPSGVELSGLAIFPPAPGLSDPVDVQIDAQEGPNASNAVLTTHYRNGETGPFAAINMSITGGTTYETTIPIPAGLSGIVQYYVQATYDGVGPNPVFAPEGGSNGPAFYNTASPYLSKEARQLHQSSHRTPFIISEIMYNPTGEIGSNSLEYIEIFNTEPIKKRIGGYRLSGDIDFTFPDGTLIAERGFLLVARDPNALFTERNVFAFGPYEGSLPNSGGRVRLRNRTDALLLEINYENQAPWPIAADGAGHSLTLTKPDYGEDDPMAWEASTQIGGTPAFDDPSTNSPLDNVIINEFLAHTDLPQTDYIELYNYGDAAVDISGCFLSETSATNKFQVPTNTIMAAGGHRTFSQSQLGFSLSSHGDEIYFVNPDQTRVIDAIRFPAQRNGVTTGRHPDGSEDYYVLAWPTTNAANTLADTRTEDIVINEIMYHPITALADEEYVELYNRGSNAVDVGHWRFTEGISFTIPPGTVVPAGGFLVIARDAAHLIPRYAQLNPSNTVGNYGGRLSNNGEHLVLARPDNPAFPFEDFVVVDEVAYEDGDDWGAWADAGGSSLELVDPRSDNRRGMNWAGSDETGKAAWTEVEHRGTLVHGGSSPNELRAMYLSRGECIVDDIVIESDDSLTTYLSDDFSSGIASWSLYGNHSRSELSGAGGVGNSQALHLRASDGGNHDEDSWSGGSEPFMNHARRPMTSTPPQGSTTRITAKVRWQKGWPHMVLALKGFWLEAPVSMDIPDNLGSPGMQNSRFASNTGPAISVASHFPVLPAVNEATLISARVNDPDGVTSVSLKYRIDPSTVVNTLAMLDDGTLGDRVAGDGLYSALLPGQAQSTTAAFTIEAEDSAVSSKTSEYPGEAPPGAPDLECLVSFGQTLKSGIIANYIMWMTAANVDRWNTIPGGKYSNEPQHLTFVYGPYRAIYNAGARWRGLWRGYSTPVSSGAYSVDVPKSDRFMGQNEFKIDQPGQNGSDGTRMNELVSYWIAREIDVPGAQIRFAHIHVNHNFRGTFHDLQVPSSDFNKSWFNDDDPRVFKDVGWAPADPYFVYKDGLGQFQQSRYRWYWRKRKGASPNDDFTTVHNVAQAVDNFPMNETGRKRIEAVVDIRGWASFFAVNGAIAGWDHYGYSYAHNMFSYVPYHKPAWLFIYDLDHVFSGGAGIFPGGGWPVPNRMFNQYDPFRRVSYAVAKELVNGPLQAATHDAFIDAWYNSLLVNNGSKSNGSPVDDPEAKKLWLTASGATLQGLVSSVDSAFSISTPDVSTSDPIVSLSGITPVEISQLSINGIMNEVRFTGINTWELDLGLPEGTNLLTITGYDWRGTALTSDTMTVTITTSPPSPVDQLVITEIMYHPVQQASEYVEIYNKSANSFDLRGWRLNGADITFEGGSIIGPGEYKLVAENRTAYQHSYGNVELAIGDYAGDLDNGGETISLQMPMGSNDWLTVDTVTYDDEAPWPLAADGLGQALQIIDINADNNRVGNWGPKDVISTNEWKFKSSTGTVSSNPFLQLAAEINLYIDVSGNVLIDKLCLVTGTVPEVGQNLLVNGDFESPWGAPWSAIGNHAGSDIATTPVYEGAGSLHIVASGPGEENTNVIVQAQSLFGLGGQLVTLSYWYREQLAENNLTVIMQGTDVALNHGVSIPPPSTDNYTSPGAASSNAQALFEFPLLWINEVMPSNTSFVADNMGEFEPWIELFNADTTPILLDDYRLSNLYSDPGKWAFPTGISVAAGQRLLIWADAEPGETTPGNLHANFELHSVSGSVVLVRDHFGEPVIIDYLDYNSVGENASYGSFPEGQPGDPHIFPLPTPATANSLTSPPIQVVINEWMSDNESTIQDPTDGKYEDWFELFNPASVPASLGGYFLTDDLSVTNKFTVPGGTVIPAESHMLVWADNDDEDNGPGIDLHVNFGLSSGGEAIGLYAPDGTLIDGVIFAAQGPDIPHGLWPDGSPVIYQLSTPTPGDTNSLFAVIGISSLDPGGFSFDTAAEVGSVYCIEGSEDLLNTNWFLIDVVTAQTAILTYTDTNAPASPLRFYRVIEKP
jgi:hypothetical protein